LVAGLAFEKSASILSHVANQAFSILIVMLDRLLLSLPKRISNPVKISDYALRAQD
jgi:hypothetical protein